MPKTNKNTWILTGFLLIIFLFLASNSSIIRENFEEKSGKDGGKCGKEKNLLPIMDPMYNMREFCKQSILLEDHLSQPRKRCENCCQKHFMTLEALAEEALTLDNENKYKDILEQLPDKCRELQKRRLNGEDPHTIAQECRKIRKNLQPLCYDKF